MAVQHFSNMRDQIDGDKAGGDKVAGHKIEIGELNLDEAAAAQWSLLLDIWELAMTAVTHLAILRDRYGLLSIGVLLMGMASIVSTSILGVLVWALLSHVLEVR